VRFQFQRQFRAAALDDAAIGQHVHHVRLDVVQQALVVGDDQERAVGAAQCVDAVGHGFSASMSRPESVSSRIASFGQHGQLEDLVALLLATGEAFVDATVQQFVLQVQHGQLLAHQPEELHGIEFFAAALRLHSVARRK
jgi:hypothetical protein